MRLLALLMALGTAAAEAAAPELSLRPVGPGLDRPAEPVVVAAVTRPEPALMREPPAGAQAVHSVQAAAFSLRPELRPPQVVEKAMAKRRAQRRGAICGDIDIQGEVVGFVPGRIQGCGVKDAVKVRAVSGISLSQQAVMDCITAKALKSWVDRSARPAFRGQGGGLARLKVAAHYACRTRNNQKGAKISEHGKGKAIDISGFYLKDGQLVTVLQGWNARATSRALRAVHKGACGPFGTVLGPNSDRFHRDHFHFDTARYRSGPYCR